MNVFLSQFVCLSPAEISLAWVRDQAEKGLRNGTTAVAREMPNGRFREALVVSSTYHHKNGN